MAMNMNPHNYEKVTSMAKNKANQIEQSHYLHNSYERFKELNPYQHLGTAQKMRILGDIILNRQIEREKQIYADLGIPVGTELNRQFFEDRFMQQILSNNYNNIRRIVATGLKETQGKSSLSQRMTKKTTKGVAEYIASVLNEVADENLEDCNELIQRIFGEEGFGEAHAAKFSTFASTSKNSKKTKTAEQATAAALTKWKGDLAERATALFIGGALKKAKKVEVTGGDKNLLDEQVKADVRFFTEHYTVGLSNKNYAVEQDKYGKWRFKTNMPSIHGSSKGATLKSMIERIGLLKGGDLTPYVSTVAARFGGDNFYYHIINEAVHATNFMASDPAEEFLNAVKELAAAWFGTQLLLDNEDGTAGQTVDFFAVGNKALIPMSSLLYALREGTARLSVSLTPSTKVNLEELYHEKTKTPFKSGAGLYSPEVLAIGREAGKQVYEGIKVSEIKLNFLLNQFVSTKQFKKR